ncbi:MAG: 2Fe-2S iron-sulfur cluster-binding protein [Dehalococcoidia bacterium]
MPTITINGQHVEVSEGASVLDAVNRSGVYLPQLCKDPDMEANGACRTCLFRSRGSAAFPRRVPCP